MTSNATLQILLVPALENKSKEPDLACKSSIRDQSYSI